MTLTLILTFTVRMHLKVLWTFSLTWPVHQLDITHLIQRPCYQRGSPCQDPAVNRTIRRPPDHRKATQTAVVWTCLPFIRSGQNHLARQSETELTASVLKKNPSHRKATQTAVVWTCLQFMRSGQNSGLSLDLPVVCRHAPLVRRHVPSCNAQ